jgi:hypothetical protein
LLWEQAQPWTEAWTILGAGTLLAGESTSAPIVVAAGLVLLLVIGIRNAWDVVTYIAVQQVLERRAEAEQSDWHPEGAGES